MRRGLALRVTVTSEALRLRGLLEEDDVGRFGKEGFDAAELQILLLLRKVIITEVPDPLIREKNRNERVLVLIRFQQHTYLESLRLSNAIAAYTYSLQVRPG